MGKFPVTPIFSYSDRMLLTMASNQQHALFFCTRLFWQGSPAVVGAILIFLLWGVNQVAVAFYHERAEVMQALKEKDTDACYSHMRLMFLTGPAVSLLYTLVNYAEASLGLE